MLATLRLFQQVVERGSITARRPCARPVGHRCLPPDAGAGGGVEGAPAQPHHPQRVRHGGRPAPVRSRRPAVGRPRRRVALCGRRARPAGWHPAGGGPALLRHPARGTRDRRVPRPLSARIGRADADRGDGPAPVQRRGRGDPAGSPGGEVSGVHAPGRRSPGAVREPRLPRPGRAACDPRGVRRPRLPRLSPGVRAGALGVRRGRAAARGGGRRPLAQQQRRGAAPGGAGRAGLGVAAGVDGGGRRRGRTPAAVLAGLARLPRRLPG